MTIDTYVFPIRIQAQAVFTNHPTHRSHRQVQLPQCRDPYVLSPPAFYPGRVTIKHWQLRDLILPSSQNPNAVYYPTDTIVHSLDLETAKTSLVCEYNFAPKCITELSGNIAAGGLIDNSCSSALPTLIPPSSPTPANERGLFSIYNSHTQQSNSIRVGSLINNSISLYKPTNSDSLYRSILCNNDRNLYFLDIAESHISKSHKIKLDCSLNNVELSPDQKTLICCGDSQNLHIIHGDFQSKVSSDHKLKTNASSGFSTTFHPSGVLFATAFQDGKVLLYDLRSLKSPLKTFYSTRCDQQNGAIRCAKFIQGSEDFLAYTEHMGRVHIVDTRNFSDHQVISYPSNYGLPGITPTYKPSSTFNQDPEIELMELELELGMEQKPTNNNFANYQPIVQTYDGTISNTANSTHLVPSRLDRIERVRRRSLTHHSIEASLGTNWTLVYTDDVTPNNNINSHGINDPQLVRFYGGLGPSRFTLDVSPSSSPNNNSRISYIPGRSNGFEEHASLNLRSYHLSSINVHNNVGIPAELSPSQRAPVRDFEVGYPIASSSSSNSAGAPAGSNTTTSNYDNNYHRLPLHLNTNDHSTSSSNSTRTDLYEYSDLDISGLGWTTFDGGSLIIGTDKGISRWKIDSWRRHCFGSVEYR